MKKKVHEISNITVCPYVISTLHEPYFDGEFERSGDFYDFFCKEASVYVIQGDYVGKKRPELFIASYQDNRDVVEIVHSTGLVTRGMQDVKDFVV